MFGITEKVLVFIFYASVCISCFYGGKQKNARLFTSRARIYLRSSDRWQYGQMHLTHKMIVYGWHSRPFFTPVMYRKSTLLS